MATIGFIGLGNMGAPMAANLVKAQHHITGFDIVATANAALAAKGGHAAAGIAQAAAAGDIVITMLPTADVVNKVIFDHLPATVLLMTVAYALQELLAIPAF